MAQQHGQLAHHLSYAQQGHHYLLTAQGDVAHLGQTRTDQKHPITPVALKHQLVGCRHREVAVLVQQALQQGVVQSSEQGKDLEIRTVEVAVHSRRRWRAGGWQGRDLPRNCGSNGA